MNKPLIINLYGGPGTGKSTTAAHLFALMKQDGFLAELVPEYAKDVVWEGRDYLLSDQLYILAKQHRRITRLQGQVDIIVTDSPLLLSHVYIEPHVPAADELHALVDAVVNQYANEHVFLRRVKPYQQAGRIQSEEKAKAKDVEVLAMLSARNINPLYVDADRKAAANIWGYLRGTYPTLLPRTEGTRDD